MSCPHGGRTSKIVFTITSQILNAAAVAEGVVDVHIADDHGLTIINCAEKMIRAEMQTFGQANVDRISRRLAAKHGDYFSPEAVQLALERVRRQLGKAA